MKRRFLCITLILAMLTSLFACGEKYKPVDSTAEEKREIMTLSLDGERYNVKYELYRAFFLQLKSHVDGGDAAVWEGDESGEYIERINEMILDRICEVYSVIHMAKKVGIDIYDNKHDKLCREYIEAAVDGDEVFKGFGGDYEAYLAALKKMNLNYSVQELFIRYEIARGEINEYYAGDAATGGLDKGHVSYTDEDILSFYESDEESRRVYNVYLPSDAFTAARAKEIRDTMASMSGDDSVAWYIMNFSTATDVGDLAELVGRYSSDTFYFGEVTDAAFTLSEGECSEPILTRTDELDGYTIVYRCEKTDDFFENYAEYIRAVYVQNEIGRIFEKTARGLYESAVYSKNYNSIVHSEIGMDE